MIPGRKLPAYFNLPRIHLLMRDAIRKFKLDLTKLNVLTEAASGYYMLTPLIAAMAGAKNVYALTKDSSYGKSSDISEATLAAAGRLGIRSRIKILYSREAPEISQADVVTNLGHVRPLDKEFLRRLKTTAAIPLMWEAWEYRPEDIDLSECRRIGIPVLATNEEHRYLRTFDYVGHLTLKLLFEAGIEVFGSKIIVLGDRKFADKAVRSLRLMGSEVKRIHSGKLHIAHSAPMRSFISECAAIVVAEHVCRHQLIGPKSPIRAGFLRRLNPGITIVHIAGNVGKDIKASCIRCYPKQPAKAGHMSFTTDYLGPRPLIDLHTAGLKIGEAMARSRLKGHNRKKAERSALRLKFAQSLSGV